MQRVGGPSTAREWRVGGLRWSRGFVEPWGDWRMHPLRFLATHRPTNDPTPTAWPREDNKNCTPGSLSCRYRSKTLFQCGPEYQEKKSYLISPLCKKVGKKVQPEYFSFPVARGILLLAMLSNQKKGKLSSLFVGGNPGCIKRAYLWVYHGHCVFLYSGQQENNVLG